MPLPTDLTSNLPKVPDLTALLQDVTLAKSVDSLLPPELQGSGVTDELIKAIQSGAVSTADADALIKKGISAGAGAACAAASGGTLAMLCTGVANAVLAQTGSFFAHAVDPTPPNADMFDLLMDPMGVARADMMDQLHDKKADLLVQILPMAGGDPESEKAIQDLVDTFYESKNGFDGVTLKPDPVNRPDDFPAAYGYMLPLLGPQIFYTDPDTGDTFENTFSDVNAAWWEPYFKKLGKTYKDAGINVDVGIKQMIAKAKTMYPQQLAYTQPQMRQQVEAMLDAQHFLYPALDDAFKLRLKNVMAGVAIKAKQNLIKQIDNLTHELVVRSGTSPMDKDGVEKMRQKAIQYADELSSGSPPSKVAQEIDRDVGTRTDALPDLTPLANISAAPIAADLSMEKIEKKHSHPFLKAVAILAGVAVVGAGGVALYRKSKGLPIVPTNFRRPLK